MYFRDLNLKYPFSLPVNLVVEEYGSAKKRFRKGSSYLAIDSNGKIKTRVSDP